MRRRPKRGSTTENNSDPMSESSIRRSRQLKKKSKKPQPTKVVRKSRPNTQSAPPPKKSSSVAVPFLQRRTISSGNAASKNKTSEIRHRTVVIEEKFQQPSSNSSSYSKPRVNDSVDTAKSSKSVNTMRDSSFQHDNQLSKRVRDFVGRCLNANIEQLLTEYENARQVVAKESQCSSFFAERNTNKNRYTDILCVESTRIILKFPEWCSDEYIHANTVSGRHLSNQFILTQGPLTKTIADFWRLVWQEKVPLIFMLCNFMEDNKRKCAEYLPMKESEGITICGIKIMTTSVTVHPGKNLTETQLQLTYSDKLLRVAHWRWTGWPDYKVPAQDLQIPFRLLTMSRSANGPTIIHCSAGVGRSGSLACLELCLRDLTDGESLNVQECVEFIRRQRAHAVQTPMQYLFIHRAILEFAVTSKIVQEAEIESFVQAYNDYVSRQK